MISYNLVFDTSREVIVECSILEETESFFKLQFPRNSGCQEQWVSKDYRGIVEVIRAGTGSKK
jgi:hypothetical protein